MLVDGGSRNTGVGGGVSNRIRRSISLVLLPLRQKVEGNVFRTGERGALLRLKTQLFKLFQGLGRELGLSGGNRSIVREGHGRRCGVGPRKLLASDAEGDFFFWSASIFPPKNVVTIEAQTVADLIPALQNYPPNTEPLRLKLGGEKSLTPGDTSRPCVSVVQERAEVFEAIILSGLFDFISSPVLSWWTCG